MDIKGFEAIRQDDLLLAIKDFVSKELSMYRKVISIKFSSAWDFKESCMLYQAYVIYE